MIDKNLFVINGKKFYASTELTKVNSFVVNSVPRPYTVTWNDVEKPYEPINEILSQNKNNLLLIDEKIYNMYDKQFRITKDKIFTAVATEEFKTLDGVIRVVGFLQEHQFTKGETLVVVGGGIIQDVGAFVGACYKRGIPWVYFPTTLLSMCDSCIGGKTGINHNQAKNQLALFSAPSQVIINPEFLTTLDFREIQSGLGEIIKLHITGGKEFIKNYTKCVREGKIINFDYYKELILGSLSVKKAIVEEDEFELNYRRCLNYGHTLGHVIEVLSNYAIPHGQGIVIGMLFVNELSNRRALLSNAENQQLKKLLFELLDESMLKIIKSIPFDGIDVLLKKDKKTISEKVNFVVLKSIGNMIFLPLTINYLLLTEIKEILKDVFGN